MKLSLNVKVIGKYIDINLTENEIIKYTLDMEPPHPLDTESSFDGIIKLQGNISYMLEHSPYELQAIREWWSEREFVGDDIYNFVEISIKQEGKIIRTKTFHNACINNYTEDIDTNSGQDIFNLELKPKLNKKEWPNLMF